MGVVITGLVNTADRWRDFFSRKERADCNLAGRFDVCICDAGRHCQNVSAVLKNSCRGVYELLVGKVNPFQLNGFSLSAHLSLWMMNYEQRIAQSTDRLVSTRRMDDDRLASHAMMKCNGEISRYVRYHAHNSASELTNKSPGEESRNTDGVTNHQNQRSTARSLLRST